MKVLFICVTLFVVFIAFTNAASLIVSNTIGSNMVLQRAPYSSSIFGWAAAKDVITVTFNKKDYNTTTAADGSWVVRLEATPAGGPYTITVSSSTGDKAAFSNILFGDVWLCGGQSNMQFTVAQGFNATEELRAADNYPDIRVFTVGQAHYSPTPLAQLADIAQGWSVASAATIGVGEWSEFSAVCWFTGRDLYDTYKVPIGLISSNWGGTIVQAWSAPAPLKACNVTTSATGNEANSVLYNAMIVPFEPQTILGVLWYQGESNVGQAPLYACLFPAMIADWRAHFPYSIYFFFVQVAPWVTTDDVADLREAQLAALKLHGVGFATAVDLGDVNSQYGNIHPRSKQPVGARLAASARAIAYGDVDLVWQGPTFVSAVAQTTGTTVTIVVTFDLYSVNGKLVAVNNTCPTGVTPTICVNWEVTLSNGETKAAVQGKIALATVEVVVSGVPSGVHVASLRYAYSPWPVTTLFNADGLPAIPFEHLF